MHCANVYGFGSAFIDIRSAHDVDLLVVHQGADLGSCQFAITCKQHLARSIERAHVTMLSENEEEFFDFIKMAQAVYLGTIREEWLRGDLVACLDRVAGFSDSVGSNCN